MSTGIPSQILFRVQALGGKFLADDIGGARIVVRDADSGVVLADLVTRGDSGNLVLGPATPGVVGAATKNVIALADGTFWWLVPDGEGGSSGVSFGMNLEAPRRLAVTAIGPLGGLSGQSRVESEVWMIPGQADGLVAAGHVIPLPGLLVQPTAPLLHTQVSPGDQVHFSAKVTMMCGCQIADGGSWPENDFVVETLVSQITPEKLVPQQPLLPMRLASTLPPSTFASLIPFRVPASGSGTVYYQASIVALQRNTANTGSATVNFYCTYS